MNKRGAFGVFTFIKFPIILSSIFMMVSGERHLHAYDLRLCVSSVYLVSIVIQRSGIPLLNIGLLRLSEICTTTLFLWLEGCYKLRILNKIKCVK